MSAEFGWKQTRPGGEAPARGNDEDAGWDLVCCEETRIPAGTWGDVPIGIAVELPFTAWGMVTGRSSTLAKRRLLVPMSVIDSGYRGELFVIAWNMNGHEAVVEKGARIGQLILMSRLIWPQQPSEVAKWVERDLSASVRGEGGFGSTGS